MKKILFSLLFCFALISGIAQDTTITWITGSGKPVDRDQGEYLRHSWQENDSLWQVRYYFPEGGVHLNGTFSDPDLSVNHGVFTCYAENGLKTSEGRYHHDNPVGYWKFWNENGDLMDHGKYLSSVTKAERDSISKRRQEKRDEAPARFRESLKDSTWEYYHENGVRSGLEVYSGGVLREWEYWNADGSEASPDAVINRIPEYPGGDRALIRYLSKNIKYPKAASRKGIHGTVHISFIIDKEGYAKDFKVLRSVSPELDNEALRVMQTMPRWSTGMAQNRLMEVKFNLPVRFRL